MALFITNKRNTRKVMQLKKKLARCKTRKCPKMNSKLRKIHDKELANKCKQKNNDAFYRCSEKVYANSGMKRDFNERQACGQEKCLKEWNALRNALS